MSHPAIGGSLCAGESGGGQAPRPRLGHLVAMVRMPAFAASRPGRHFVATLVLLALVSNGASGCVDCEADCAVPEVLVVAPDPADVEVRLCERNNCTAWTSVVSGDASEGLKDRSVLIAVPRVDGLLEAQARDASGTATQSKQVPESSADSECGCPAGGRRVVLDSN